MRTLGTWVGGLTALLVLSSAAHGYQLQISPAAVSQSVAQGAENGTTSVALSAVPGTQMSFPFAAASSVAWLVCDPPAGTVTPPSTALTLRFRTGQLAPGSYTGRVTVVADDLTNSPVEVPVVVQITAHPAVIRLAPQEVRVSVEEFSTDCVEREIEVWNGSGSAVRDNMVYDLMESEYWLDAPSSHGSSTGQHVRHTLAFTNLQMVMAGSYTAQVLALSAYAVNSPQAVKAVLDVRPRPAALWASTNLLRESCGQGQWAPGSSFQVANTNSSSMDFTLSTPASWVYLWPTNGTSTGPWDPTTIYVSYSSASLAPRTHAAWIRVASPQATTAVDVGVALTVTSMPQVLGAAFTHGTGAVTVAAGSTPDPFGLQVWNAGTGSFRYGISIMPPVSWLSVLPAGGTAGTARVTHALQVLPAGLAPGEYGATLFLTGADGDMPANAPWTQEFRVRVASALEAAPAALSRSVRLGEAGGATNLSVWDSAPVGGTPVVYTVEWDGDWLDVSPPGGMTIGDTNTLTVTFNTAGLAAGAHRGEIRIRGTDQVLRIPVLLSVQDDHGRFEERIVFGGDLDGDMDLWMIAADGTGLRRLLRKPGRQGRPQVCPNGTQVLFHDEGATERRSLLLSLDSGRQSKLPLLYAPRWLPDGRSFADIPRRVLGFEDPLTAFEDPLTAFENPIVALENPLAGFEDPLTAFEDPLTAFEDPLTAFEDPLTAFEDPLTAFANPIVANVAGGAARLAGGPGRKTMIGVQRGTENLFCFSVPAAGGLAPSIGRLDRATGRMTQVLPPDGLFRHDGTISPDGRYLAYARARGDWRRSFVTDLVVLDLETARERIVARADGTRYASPCFSPDGRRLAFTARSGSNSWLQLSWAGGTGATTLVQRTNVRADALWGVSWAPVRTMSPGVSVSPSVLSLSTNAGSTNSLTGQFEVWNPADSFLQYYLTSDVPWISVSPVSGTSTGEHDAIRYSVGCYGMTQGSHTGRVTIVSNATNGGPATVEFRLAVGPPAPRFRLPAAITAGSRTNAASFLESLSLANLGGGSAGYHAVANMPWISILNPDGDNGGETDDLRLLLNPAGLLPGSYTGLVTVTAGGVVYETTVTLDVAVLDTRAPELSVSPQSVSVSVPRYQDAATQTFSITNAGGQVLRYYVEESLPWLDVQELSASNDLRTCVTERDTIHLLFDTDGLGMGLYTGSVRVVDEGGTGQTVRVTLTVGDPAEYTLTIVPHAGGSVFFSPMRAGNRYTHGTTVSLTATPDVAHVFDRWLGRVSPFAARTAEILMDRDQTVEAMFDAKPRLWGYVFNSRDASPIKGATVAVGTATGETASNGYYEVYSGEGSFACWAERPGYEASDYFAVDVPPDSSESRFFFLEPEFVGPVKAAQCDQTHVMVDYYLAGLPGDRFTVQLQTSPDGVRWYARNAEGDSGAGVPQGFRRLVWDAGASYVPGYTATGMLARIVAGGCTGTSAPFPLDLSTANRAIFAFWIDANLNGVRELDEPALASKAEVYIGGRTASFQRGVVDTEGGFAYPYGVRIGDAVFARKLITDRVTKKSHHEQVGSVMRRMWLDSDLGAEVDAWNGEWKTYQLSRDDIVRAQRGETIYIRLGHPVFEWNLILDMIDNARLVSNLVASLPMASEHLYKVTHGQMKFGKFFVWTGPDTWDKADVLVRRMDDPSNASVGGIYDNWDMYNIEMDVEWLDLHSPTNNFDLRPPWARMLVHEFGHYGLSFQDEYRTCDWEKGWRAFRTNYPAFYPLEYGLMDHENAGVNQLSSDNDYPPSWGPVRAAIRADLPFLEQLPYDTDGLIDEEFGMPYQFYEYREPCWEDMEGAFVTVTDQEEGTPIRFDLVKEKRGRFENGKSTVVDRQGPQNGIPAPYNVCAVKVNEDGEWIVTEGAVTGGARPAAAVEVKSAASGAERQGVVLASCDGSAAAGALVVLRSPTSEPLYTLGRTGRDGALAWRWPLAAGDAVEGYWRGRKAAWACEAGLFDGVVRLDFSSKDAGKEAAPLSEEPAGALAGGALAPGQLGLVVSVRLDATNITLRLQASAGLAAPPAVSAWSDDGATSAVPMAAEVGNTVFAGAIAVSNGFRGQVEISCTDTNGRTLESLDEYRMWPLRTNAVSAAALSGSASLRASGADGVLYRYRGPVAFPPGAACPSNQVGDAWAVGIDTDLPLDATNHLGLSLTYPAADMLGLDATTLGLYRWHGSEWAPGAAVWHDPVGHSFSAEVTNLAMYVLLASPSADTVAPGAVTELQATAGSNALEVVLSWTAAGDDGDAGTAAAYDVRYATVPLETSTWLNAWAAAGPDPAPAGSTQSLVLSLPSCLETYYFALCALDEAGNRGPMSDVAAAVPALDDADGDGISDRWLADVVMRLGGAVNLDDDVDGDRLSLRDEYGLRLDPLNADTDGDGMDDGYEVEYGLDAGDATDREDDPDGDGAPNWTEAAWRTNPRDRDSDDDGMDDGWEILHGLDPLTMARAQGGDDNPDGDPFPNLGEFVADTDPLDEFSYLRIEGLTNSPSLRVRFLGSADRLYTLWQSTNLTGGAWESLPGQTRIRGAGGQDWLEGASGATNRFYKLGVELP